MVIVNDIEQLNLIKVWNYRVIHELLATRSLDPDKRGFMSFRIDLRNPDPTFPTKLMLYFDDCVDIKMRDIFTLSGIELSMEVTRSNFFREVSFFVKDIESDSFEFPCVRFAADVLSNEHY